MVRKLKAFGLTLVAMLALGVVVASAAQANEFKAAEYPATIKGEQKSTHNFVIGGNRTLTCAGAEFNGTLAGASKELTITPTYSSCHVIIAGSTLDATVTMEGCDYLFTEPAGGKVHFKCPAGKTVVIHVYNGAGVEHTAGNELCRYTIAEQSNLGTVTYANQATTPKTVVQTANVTGVAVKRAFGTLGNCGAESQTAVYTGETTVKAFNSKDIQINGEVG
ncbi:MAG: hypothetical protein JST31_05370 [Actinobacteria bacterium]|nr:hypothetical protein [Actinomycetota bacterium]